MQCSLVEYQWSGSISHNFYLYFLSIHACVKACVCTKKMQVTCRIFHGIPLESIAFFITSIYLIYLY